MFLFCLVSVNFLLVTYLLWRQTTPRSRWQRRTRVNLTRFNRLWHKQTQKSNPSPACPPEKSVRFGTGDRLASFPGGKPENELGDLVASATWLLRLRMRTIILNGIKLQGRCWSVLFFAWWEPMKLGRFCGIVDLRAEKCSPFTLKAQWVLTSLHRESTDSLITVTGTGYEYI